MTNLHHLPQLSVVNIDGADAATILHNITTNAVKTLGDGEGCETFITDVRGKTLGHGYLYRTGDRFQYIGAANQSQVIVDHMDKYTIREDAVPTIADGQFESLVVSPDQVAQLGITTPKGELPSCWKQPFGGAELMMFRVAFLGTGSVLVLVESDRWDAVRGSLLKKDIALAEQADFHRARVLAGFPWYGVDLDEKNLPQEVDRDDTAVSFTKGCYLGQETVARLDALGQVQRKLVKWSIDGAVPTAGSTLESEGKAVGRLTSVASPLAAGPTKAIALGYARRSHFDAGANAQGIDSRTGQVFTGTVLGLDA
jgi:folate-binding protein YgfZ